MRYIDLDGVIANVEKHIYKLGGVKAIEDPCTFIRLCAEHSNIVFRESEVIDENLNLIFESDDFRILTSLPHLNKFIEFNKDFYDSRTLSEKYSQLRENKFEWVSHHFNDDFIPKLLIVNDSNEKLFYCRDETDFLYDDYYKTVNAWTRKGGQATLIPFKRDFL